MRRVKEPGARGGQVRNWVIPAAHLLGIGWYFATCIILGIALGVWVDSALGTEPTFTLIGIFLGLAVAIVGGYRLLLPFLRRLGDEPPEKG
jgi:hypothetical protein